MPRHIANKILFSLIGAGSTDGVGAVNDRSTSGHGCSNQFSGKVEVFAHTRIALRTELDFAAAINCQLYESKDISCDFILLVRSCAKRGCHQSWIDRDIRMEPGTT